MKQEVLLGGLTINSGWFETSAQDNVNVSEASFVFFSFSLFLILFPFSLFLFLTFISRKLRF